MSSKKGSVTYWPRLTWTGSLVGIALKDKSLQNFFNGSFTISVLSIGFPMEYIHLQSFSQKHSWHIVRHCSSLAAQELGGKAATGFHRECKGQWEGMWMVGCLNPCSAWFSNWWNPRGRCVSSAVIKWLNGKLSIFDVGNRWWMK